MMPVGKTKDAGWQIGVSRTVHRPTADVWDFLNSTEGLSIWLGDLAGLPHERGEGYETADGIRGEVRSYHERNRVRLTWRPSDWDHDTTVQVALRDRGDRTTVVFHQERLADPAERERQREHWTRVADEVQGALG